MLIPSTVDLSCDEIVEELLAQSCFMRMPDTGAKTIVACLAVTTTQIGAIGDAHKKGEKKAPEIDRRRRKGSCGVCLECALGVLSQTRSPEFLPPRTRIGRVHVPNPATELPWLARLADVLVIYQRRCAFSNSLKRKPKFEDQPVWVKIDRCLSTERLSRLE